MSASPTDSSVEKAAPPDSNKPPNGGDFGGSPNFLEGWKALIDFTKTIISISITLFAALIAFYVTHSGSIIINIWNGASPAFLAASIALSIYSFGYSIAAIKLGRNFSWARDFANASAIALFCGILSLAFIRLENNISLNQIISNIEAQSQLINLYLPPQNLESIHSIDGNYIATYNSGPTKINVTYSTSDGKITGFSKFDNTPPPLSCNCICSEPKPKPKPPYHHKPRPTNLCPPSAK